jgi:hypothetical protein
LAYDTDGGGGGYNELNQGLGNNERCPSGDTGGGHLRSCGPVPDSGDGCGPGGRRAGLAGSRPPLRSRDPAPSSSAPGKTFTPSNPFANPAALQTLKASFSKQPNWRAAVMEGTAWEGNADENAAKWRKLNRIEA